MAENVMSLKDTLINYDKAGSVPAHGFSKEQIASSYKVKRLVEVIKFALNDVKKKGKDIFENFNVTFDISSIDNVKPFDNAVNLMGLPEVIDDNNKDLVIPVNFNYSQLAKLGSVEVYIVAFSTMYNALLKKKALAVGNAVDFGKGGKDQSKKAAENGNANGSGSNIFEYVKKFLDFFFTGNENIKNMDYSACAEQVELNLKTRGFAAEDLFDNPKGVNLFAERFAKVSKLGYQQQATSLVGVFSKKEFNSIQNGSETQIKEVCQKFADQFLKNSGVESGTYSIEFGDAKGDLGRYIDKGLNGQSVVIDLNAIRKLENPAELWMTLAHELTHMVDSSRNKADMVDSSRNKEDGKMSRKFFGLSEHNLVGSVNEDAPDFVKRMEEIYYDVNPHERSARQGELVALEFMMQMQPDETMKKYIKQSLKSFQNYQRNTLKTLQSKVDNLIEEYETGKFSYDVKTMQYVERVMEDLKKMKEEGLLDISDDLKALNDSRQIESKYMSESAVSALGE